MEVSNPQVEQIAHHPLEAVIQKLDYLLESLKLEVEVAPTDRKAHQDLLHRTIQACEVALQIPDQAWPVSLPAVPGEAQVMTEEDKEWIESVDWVEEGEVGEEIDVDDPTQAITIVEDDREFDPEIEALRQQGWKIMTVSQVAQNVEQLAAPKSDTPPLLT